MSDWDIADYGLLDPVWAGTAVANLTSDAHFLTHLLHVETQWMQTLADHDLAEQSQPDTLRAFADNHTIDLADLAGEVGKGGNPVIPLLKLIRQDIGSPESLHKGATSQDVVDTALILMAKKAGETAVSDLKKTVSQLVGLAITHKNTPMVARTLAQHSLPTTFGLRVAGWADGITTAAQQLESTLAELPVQWFGAAGTMAALSEYLDSKSADHLPTPFELTEAFASSLGLRMPAGSWDTIRVTITQLASALANVAIACGKMANDILISVRSENGELSEPVAAGRGTSSAMPHKKNPILSVLIKTAATMTPGALSQVYSAAAASLEERPDGGWHAEWHALKELIRLAGAVSHHARELTSGLVVHKDKMSENLAIMGPFLVSERIMTELAPLVTTGDATSGREVVQGIIDECLQDQNKNLRDEILRVVDQGITAEHLDTLLDASNYTGESSALVDRLLVGPQKWSK